MSAELTVNHDQVEAHAFHVSDLFLFKYCTLLERTADSPDT